MKKVVYILSICFLFGLFSSSVTSCKTGKGCPAEEAYEKSKEKPLSGKRGKSRLFKKK